MKFAIHFDFFPEPTRYDTREQAQTALDAIRERMGINFKLMFQYTFGILEIPA